jgi:Wax ester synthase/diacylglycerol acyltransferase catalytic domain
VGDVVAARLTGTTDRPVSANASRNGRRHRWSGGHRGAARPRRRCDRPSGAAVDTGGDALCTRPSRDNIRRRIQGLHGLLPRIAHPVSTLRQAQSAWPAWRELWAEERAPRTSLNRQVGGHRTLALIRSRLGLAKRIAHAHDAKINDIVRAAVGGGLRELLASRGEQVDALVLRAMVPVSLHHERPGQARGNLDGMMIVPLPLGEPDRLQLLERVAAETLDRKKRARPQSCMRPWRELASWTQPDARCQVCWSIATTRRERRWPRAASPQRPWLSQRCRPQAA